MLKKWAEKSTAILYGNHIIEEKIIPLYVYGFQLLYSILLIGTSTFLLSVLFQRKAEWFIFIFCFFVCDCVLEDIMPPHFIVVS